MHTIQIIFFTSLCFFITTYILENYANIPVRDNIKHYTNETLYTLKIKERPKKEPFVGLIKSIITAVTKIPDMFIGLFNIIKFLKSLALGIVFMVTGLILSFAMGFQPLAFGVYQFLIFIVYCAEWAITNVMCFTKMIMNGLDCIFWFFLDLMGKLMYLIPSAVFLFLELIGFYGYEIERQVWVGLEKLNSIVFHSTGFHIIHFPKWVRDRCYNCKRLKLNSVVRQFGFSFKTLGRKFPKQAKPGIDLFIKGGKEFKTAFEMIGKMF